MIFNHCGEVLGLLYIELIERWEERKYWKQASYFKKDEEHCKSFAVEEELKKKHQHCAAALYFRLVMLG